MAEFLYLSGDVSLDFVNTELVLRHARVDTLTDDEAVANWLRGAGLAPPTDPRGLATAARGLRAAIREIATATAERRAPSEDSIAILNEFLARPAAVHVLDRRGKLLVASLRVMRDDAASCLYPIAVAAMTLFTERDHRHVKKCANPHCILFFYDSTKSHTRRWCSMGVCGNRAKAAEFARRRRALVPELPSSRSPRKQGGDAPDEPSPLGGERDGS